MPSDIELGEDESITFSCAEMRAQRTGGLPVDLRGELAVRDRVWITVQSYAKAEAHGLVDLIDAPTRLEPGGGLARAVESLGAGITGPTTIATIDGSTIEYTGPGKTISSKLSVFDLLRREGRVDLATELSILRAAILELHDRMGGAK